MKFKDAIFVIITLLLVIVVLLLIPSICSCAPKYASMPAWFGGTPSSSTPIIKSSLDPAAGPVGTEVTIHGAGFGTANTILMNSLTAAPMKNVASPDGKTLTFSIPPSIGPNCQPGEMCAQFLVEVTPASYKISVITGSSTQDIGAFAVTAK